MKLLLHTCCGPCMVYPWSILKEDFELCALFFNPNVHPYKEFVRRRDSFQSFCTNNNVSMIGPAEYGMREFLRRVVGDEENRCIHCYSWRLEETARNAAELGFNFFSSTLLYSRYQDHENLKSHGFLLAKKYGVNFLYQDFRVGWQQGIDQSIALGMYRQPYCGCIYSEQERYDKSLRRKK